MNLINPLEEQKLKNQVTRPPHSVPLLKIKRKRYFSYIQKKILLLSCVIVALLSVFFAICFSKHNSTLHSNTMFFVKK